MKRILVLAVAAVVFGGGHSQAAPQLKFDKTEYDFGTTGQVQSVTGTFTFQNTGDAELEIRKPSPSCGCTGVEVKPDKLAPGAKGELKFNLNIGHARGPQVKYITVPSNDPQQAQVKLTLKVNVEATFDVRPPAVNVGELHLNETTNVEASITRVDGKALEIQKLVSSADLITARAEPGPAGTNPTARIVMQVKGQGAPRRFVEKVTVLTGDPATPEVVIQLYGGVVGDLRVMPERLVWGVGKLDRLPAERLEAAMTRQVTIAGTRVDHPLELKNPTSSLKDISLQLAPVTEEKAAGQPAAAASPKAYRLTAKLTQTPKASATGTITLETNVAEQPTIIIPVAIHVIAP